MSVVLGSDQEKSTSQVEHEIMKRGIAQEAADDRISHEGVKIRLPVKINTPISNTQFNSMSFGLMKGPRAAVSVSTAGLQEDIVSVPRQMKQNTQAPIMNQMTTDVEEALTSEWGTRRALHQREIHSENLERHTDETMTNMKSVLQQYQTLLAVIQIERNVMFEEKHLARTEDASHTPE